MTAFVQNATLALGTDFTLAITIYQDEAETTPKDLTGTSAIDWDLLTDRPHEPTARSVVAKTLGSGVTIQDAVGGIINVVVDSADQANLEQLKYYHRTNLTDASGNASRPTVGFLDFQA